MTSHRIILPALAFALSGSAFAQVVLDDYSSDHFSTDYVQKSIPGFDLGGWSVTNGELRPDSVTEAGGYAAFVWTSHSLQNAGDWFSIELSVAAAAGEQNAGLSVWKSTDGAIFDRVVEPRLSYNSTYAFIGSDQEGQLWADGLSPIGLEAGSIGLRVTLVGYIDGDALLDFELFNQNGALSPTRRYAVVGHTGPLYVGPSAWQANGANIAFDNLAYFSAVIPEPSAFAVVFGTFAFSAAVVRRRGRKAACKDA